MQLRCGALATEAARHAEETTSLKVIIFPVPDITAGRQHSRLKQGQGPPQATCLQG